MSEREKEAAGAQRTDSRKNIAHAVLETICCNSICNSDGINAMVKSMLIVITQLVSGYNSSKQYTLQNVSKHL